jgi:hypothetical protein
MGTDRADRLDNMVADMRLEVRCCCQPTKLFGTLPVPTGAIERGCFDVVVANTTRWWEADDPSASAFEKHSVQIRKFQTIGGITRLAIYSEDRPIEFWRKLPGFQEKRK